MKVFAITGTVLLLPLAFYGIVYLSAKESRDCSQMVIDGYEVRSGIDIPKVQPINCYYDPEMNLRVSVFQLEVPARQFIGSRKLLITDKNPLKSGHLLAENDLPKTEKLFTRAGSRWGDQWQYVVEPESGRLWVEVLFQD